MKDYVGRTATLIPDQGEILAESLNQALTDVTADPGVDSVNTPNDFWLNKLGRHLRRCTSERAVDLRTVQLWLGHRDLESTMRYLKPARGKGVRDKQNAAFDGAS